MCSATYGALVARHYCHDDLKRDLHALGVDYFRPVQQIIRTYHGRRTESFAPILGDYVLTEITDRWKSINTLDSTLGWLMNAANHPATVLPEEMEYLRAICPNGVMHYASPMALGFKYGDRVSPQTGPLAHRIGRYDRKTRRGDSALFLLFGREQTIQFKSGELIAA